MTKRLEEAIKKLTPEQEEMLAVYAESISEIPLNVGPGEPMKLNWIGGAKEMPEKSGLEAQKRANEIRVELLRKGMPE